MHRSKVFVGGKRAAAKALEEFVKEVRESEATSVVGTTATLGSLLDKWLVNLERIGKARSTLETYRIHVEKHIRPALGSRRLDKLTAQDVDAYLGTLADKGLSPRTIKLDHAVLSGAMAQAVDWGWLKANPAKKAKLPGGLAPEAPSISVDQVVQLYSAALADEDPDMALAIVLGAITGCRRGGLPRAALGRPRPGPRLPHRRAGMGPRGGWPASHQDQDRQGPEGVHRGGRGRTPRRLPGGSAGANGRRGRGSLLVTTAARRRCGPSR